MQRYLLKEPPGLGTAQRRGRGQTGAEQSDRTLHTLSGIWIFTLGATGSVQSRETSRGCHGSETTYPHFAMITIAGREKGLERVRDMQGGEPGAVVGDGVQNPPLWHENYL